MKAQDQGTRELFNDLQQQNSWFALVALIPSLISLLYSLLYWFVFEDQISALFNFICCLGFSISIVINHYGRGYLARWWLMLISVVNLIGISTVIFGPASGAHYYFLLHPLGVFFVFTQKQFVERSSVAVIATLCFLFCHYFQGEPMVQLSNDQINGMFNLSIVSIALSIFASMTFFGNKIAKQKQQLHELANKDLLTQINNRRSFFSNVNQLFTDSVAANRSLAIIMLDLDNFKLVNDQHGHQVGDYVLAHTAQLIAEHNRSGDVFARYGGEEFIIALPETSLEQAQSIAERLRNLLASEVIRINKLELTLTASMGVAEFSDQITSLSELINCADKALYQAKCRGRDCVVCHAAA
ncbi:GGDEF domain-containing protein [Endozoicomonas sp. G2_1]|uniref:GGDEF domain-containing protein n=1 Tax=Endozoicomonas sp. G2_1 TaxID=2821091 RepID=UPI001ADB0CED|nr:GGDEF domain-containing protein [Endozoicomonas sp. G2_1]MBO9492162.1 GGDEF domain-containing protein [Endozoicomonas sp. G2_1]